MKLSEVVFDRLKSSSAWLKDSERRGTSVGTGQSYWMNHPVNPASDGNSGGFQIVVDLHNDEIGYRYQPTNETGNKWQLAQMLGIDVEQFKSQRSREYENRPVVRTAYSSAEEYCASRGIDWQVVQRKMKAEVSFRNGRVCIAIPEPHGFMNDETPNKYWYRYLDGYGEAWELSPNMPYGWLNGSRAVDIAEEKGFGWILLTNSVSSVMAGVSHNLPVLAYYRPVDTLDGASVRFLKKVAGERKIIINHPNTKRAIAWRNQIEGSIVLDLDKGDLGQFAALHEDTLRQSLSSRIDALVALTPEDRLNIILNGTSGENKQEPLPSDHYIDLWLDREIMKFNATDCIIGLETGWDEFDKTTLGFQPELYTFVAFTNMGKTWLAASLASRILRKHPQAKIGVFNGEIMHYEWMGRCVQHALCANGQELIHKFGVHNVKTEVAKLIEGRFNYSERFFFSPPGATDISDIAHHFHGVMQRVGGLDAIIFDSSDQLTTLKYNDKQYAAIYVWTVLQRMFQQWSIPIIATGQMGRNAKYRNNTEPQLSDLGWTQESEQKNGVVIAWNRPVQGAEQLGNELDEAVDPNYGYFKILKNRTGGNVGKRIDMHFKGDAGLYPVRQKHDIFGLGG